MSSKVRLLLPIEKHFFKASFIASSNEFIVSVYLFPKWFESCSYLAYLYHSFWPSPFKIKGIYSIGVIVFSALSRSQIIPIANSVMPNVPSWVYFKHLRSPKSSVGWLHQKAYPLEFMFKKEVEKSFIVELNWCNRVHLKILSAIKTDDIVPIDSNRSWIFTHIKKRCR